MIEFGNTPINNIHFGTEQVKSIHLGNILIWSSDIERYIEDVTLYFSDGTMLKADRSNYAYIKGYLVEAINGETTRTTINIPITNISSDIVTLNENNYLIWNQLYESTEITQGSVMVYCVFEDYYGSFTIPYQYNRLETPILNVENLKLDGSTSYTFPKRENLISNIEIIGRETSYYTSGYLDDSWTTSATNSLVNLTYFDGGFQNQGANADSNIGFINNTNEECNIVVYLESIVNYYEDGVLLSDTSITHQEITLYGLESQFIDLHIDNEPPIGTTYDSSSFNRYFVFDNKTYYVIDGTMEDIIYGKTMGNWNDYTITSNKDWLIYDTTNNTLRIEQNTTNTQRIALLNISTSNNQMNFIVTQNG